MDVFEKINKAVIVSSTIQTLRGISHQSRANLASNSSPSIPLKTTDISSKPDSSKHHKSHRPSMLQGREALDVVHISFDYSSQSGSNEKKPKSATPFEPAQKNTQVAKVVLITEPEDPPTYIASPGQVAKANPKVGSPKCNIHIENSFTDYINRVRARMRTISDIVGDVPNFGNLSNACDGKNASGKDEFSEYIDRARMKLRTTSSTSGGGFECYK